MSVAFPTGSDDASLQGVLAGWRLDCGIAGGRNRLVDCVCNDRPHGIRLNLLKSPISPRLTRKSHTTIASVFRACRFFLLILTSSRERAKEISYQPMYYQRLRRHLEVCCCFRKGNCIGMEH